MTVHTDDITVPEADTPAPAEVMAELTRERLRRQDLEDELARRTQSLEQANASLVALSRRVDHLVEMRTADLARDRDAAQGENAAKT